MFQSNAPIKGLSQDWGGGGQLMGIRLSEVQVGREFDTLNVPRVGTKKWNFLTDRLRDTI